MSGFLNSLQNFLSEKIFMLKNLFCRYDRVKVPEVKPWEYCDKTGFLLYASMKILVDFVQKEKIDDVIWYYGETQYKLGHDQKLKIYMQQYRGKNVMDIVKQIYAFWKKIYVQKQEQIFYLQQVYYKYILGKMSISEQTYQILFDFTNLPKTVEQVKDQMNWQILDKYLQGDRQNLFKENFLKNKLCELQNELQNDCQKYLHLLIDIRPYLWT